MTENQKTRILEMRRLGCTYRYIAANPPCRKGPSRPTALELPRKAR